MGVTTILVNEIEEITGNFRATDVGISYIADNIIFLRYLEIEGQMRKAIGVLKKRLSDFEKTLREFQDTIVSQDIPTVESQRPRRLPLNNDAEFHLPSDRASLAYRKWLKQLGVKFGTIF